VDWNHVAEDKVQCERDNKSSGSVKGE